MSSQHSKFNQRGYSHHHNSIYDLHKYKRLASSFNIERHPLASVKIYRPAKSQQQFSYLLKPLVSATHSTKGKSRNMLSSQSNYFDNRGKSEETTNTSTNTSATSRCERYTRSIAKTATTTVAITTSNQSIMSHLILVLSMLYLLVATLSVATNAQMNGQLYQAPSLAPSATLNNQNIASNKHLFSMSNNQQQYPSQQTQLLQQNTAGNSNQFRPILAPNTQSLAPKEQLARPASDAQSLQTAESNQDSYLSNTDMNDISDIMRSHYDGSASNNNNNNRKQQQSNDNNQNWNSNQLNNNQQVSPNQKYDGPQQASPSNHAGSAANSGGYYDEGDYDDEGTNSANDGPVGRPAVPNKRAPQSNNAPLAGSSTNQNHKRNYVNQNSNNDYNSGTDDAYFNRRGTQKSPSLRTEASYNRNHHGRGDSSERSERGNNNQQESQGFGPGPNEAFMADKNEAAGGANEQDEEGAFDGPSGGEGSNVDDDGPPQGFGGGPSSGGGPDQQSTNQLNYKEPAGANALSGNGNNGGVSGGDSSQADNDDSDIVGDGSGSDIDGADSDFPTGYDPNSADMDDSPRQPVAAATHQGTTNANSGLRGRTSTSASASAPAPLSALSPLTMRLQQQQQHQRLAGEHRPTLSSSYNPQTNPSHVGKFFIN